MKFQSKARDLAVALIKCIETSEARRDIRTQLKFQQPAYEYTSVSTKIY